MKGKDNIENSFIEQFSSSSIKNEGWNNPSDSIWKGIEDEIYMEKKRTFGYLPFLLINFLILSLIASGYLYQQNLKLKNELEEKSKNLQIVSSHASSDLNNSSIETSSIKDEDINKTNQNPSIYPYQESNRIIDKKIVKEYLEISSGIEAGGKEQLPKNTLLININEEKDNPAISYSRYLLKNKNVELYLNNSTIRRENILTNDMGADLKLLTIINNDSITKSVEIHNPEKSIKAYLSFLPQIGVNILTTSGERNGGLTELIDKEYGNIGLGFDIIYNYPISNKLEFTSGLGIESMSFTTEYDITLPYSISEEVIEGNHGYIDFQHSLPTAFGNTETELRLSRIRNSTIGSDPNVGLDFNSNHRFLAISLPVGLKYKIGSENSFFRFGLSTRPTYILKSSSSVKSVYSYHSEIDAINNKSQSIYADIRRLNLSVGFDVGYQLFITEKSGLRMNIGYQDYLFDIYKLDNFSSSLDKFGFSLGYTYSI